MFHPTPLPNAKKAITFQETRVPNVQLEVPPAAATLSQLTVCQAISFTIMLVLNVLLPIAILAKATQLQSALHVLMGISFRLAMEFAKIASVIASYVQMQPNAQHATLTTS